MMKMQMLLCNMAALGLLLVLPGCIAMGNARQRDLILVAGQSNAVGYDADPAKLPGEPGDKDVLFWWRCGDPPPDKWDSTSGGMWTHLQPQPRGKPMPKDGTEPGEKTMGIKRQYGNFSKPAGGFGPEIGMARALRASDASPLAIVKVAFSGTGMRTDWDPKKTGDAGACYRALVRETKAAIAAAKEQGITLRPRALVWVQGESDSNANDAPHYAQRLGEMIAALRNDLGAPHLIALLGVNTSFKNTGKIIEAQKTVAAKNPNCRYVDTTGAEVANAYHFSTAGTLEVGRRFAEALRQAELKLHRNELEPAVLRR